MGKSNKGSVKPKPNPIGQVKPRPVVIDKNSEGNSNVEIIKPSSDNS